MIELFSAKNYKSLKELEIPLQPLTVFVGPNASGKSNIMDGIHLVSEIVRTGLRMRAGPVDKLVADRGGYEACVWGGISNRPITLEVRGNLLRQQADGQSFGYGVQVALDSAGQPAVEKEWLRQGDKPVEFRTDWTTWKTVRGTGSVSGNTSVLARIAGDLEASSILDNLGSWAFYHFNPRAMKEPQPIRKEYRLEPDGHNLSTVLHTLYSESHPSWHEISEMMKVFLPRVEKLISPVYEEGKTYAALIEKGLTNHIGTWAMSDGTLFALALATALATPQRPELLAIEAPDTEIHPRLMEHVAEMLIAASMKTQVLITTHSPYLLDYLPPGSIVIVENRNAQTVLKQVAKKKVLEEAIKSLGAGRAWYAGHLGGVP